MEARQERESGQKGESKNRKTIQFTVFYHSSTRLVLCFFFHFVLPFHTCCRWIMTDVASNSLTLCFSPYLALLFYTTVMRFVWGTIFGWRIEMVSEHRCSGYVRVLVVVDVCAVCAVRCVHVCEQPR